MSSKLQLDVCHLNRWWHHLVNAYELRQAWCLLQVKLPERFKVVFIMQDTIQVLGFFYHLVDSRKLLHVFHTRKFITYTVYQSSVYCKTLSHNTVVKFICC